MDREKVINIYANCLLNDKQYCSDCYTGGPGLGIACRQQVLTDALYLLKDLDNCENCAIAIEDRQLVVRCKDCIHKNGLNHCPHNNDIWVADDWFCADGEKKDERCENNKRIRFI